MNCKTCQRSKVHTLNSHNKATLERIKLSSNLKEQWIEKWMIGQAIKTLIKSLSLHTLWEKENKNQTHNTEVVPIPKETFLLDANYQ